MLVDMPLNSIPSTTNVDCAGGETRGSEGQVLCRLGCLGRSGSRKSEEIELLAKAGVRGFKCFLVHPGIEEFTMVCEQDLRRILAAHGENRTATAGARGTSRSHRSRDRRVGNRELVSVLDLPAIASGRSGAVSNPADDHIVPRIRISSAHRPSCEPLAAWRFCETARS